MADFPCNECGGGTFLGRESGERWCPECNLFQDAEETRTEVPVDG